MKQKPPQAKALSLVEVVLALGIASFALVALIGLFSVGQKMSRESEDQVQAANLASQMLSLCVASPIGSATGLRNTSNPPGIPILSNTPFANVYPAGNKYVDFSGMLTTDPKEAAYRITCSAGTTSLTGTHLSQVHLLLTWPPQAEPTQAAGRYEIISYIPLR